MKKILLALLLIPSVALAQTGQLDNNTSTTTLDMTSATAALNLDVNGMSTVGVQIITSTATGQVQAQVSNDGTTYTALNCATAGSSGPTVTNGFTAGTSAFYSCNVAGFRKFRVAVSSTGANTASISLAAKSASSEWSVLYGIYPGTAAASLGKAEDAGHTSGDVGVMALGVYQSTPSQIAGTTLDYSTINVGPEGGVYTGSIASAVGGATISRTASAGSNNSTSVKGSAGSVYTVIACNSNAAIRYVKLYNKATAPSCGSDTPVATILLPATNCVNLPQQVPLAFPLGIGFCMVTGVADSDNTAVTANDVLLTLGYK
jgi:hypothetical protein